MTSILALAKAFFMTKVTGIFLDFSEAKMSLQVTVAPKVGMGGWRPVKKERVTFSDRLSEKVHKQKEPYTEKVFSIFFVSSHSLSEKVDSN